MTLSLVSAYTSNDGTKAYATISGGALPLLPATGMTGWTAQKNGASLPISGYSFIGNVIVFAFGSAVASTDAVTLSYAPGNLVDSTPTTPQTLAAVSAFAVTNYVGKLFALDLFQGVTGGASITTHAPNVGGSWSHPASTPSGDEVFNAARTGYVRTANGNDTLSIITAAPAAADYDVQCDFLWLGSNGSGHGPALRVVNGGAETFYVASSDGTNLSIVSKTSGAGQNLAQAASALVVGQTYNVKLSARGSTLTTFVNGVQKSQITDTGISGAGMAGFYSSGQLDDTSGAQMTNFVAANAVATVAPTFATIPVSDSNLYTSPYTWDKTVSGKILSNSPGAYLKMAFTGTSLAVNVNVAALVTAGTADINYPRIKAVIDGGVPAYIQLSHSSASVPLASGLGAGTHAAFIELVGINTTNTGDRWTTPVDALVITSFTVDGGAATAPLFGPISRRPNNMITFSDSTGEGASLNGGVDSIVNVDTSLTWSKHLAAALNAEVGQNCYQSQGWEIAAVIGNVPGFRDMWNLQRAGVARDFSAPFDFAVIQHGHNGGTTASDISTMVANLRSKSATGKILVIAPFQTLIDRTVWTTWAASNTDPNAHYIDLGAPGDVQVTIGGTTLFGELSFDGVHPNFLGHARGAASMAGAIETTIGGAGGPVTLSGQVTLSTADEAALASLPALTTAVASVLARIGTPAGASLAADIAANQTAIAADRAAIGTVGTAVAALPVSGGPTDASIQADVSAALTADGLTLSVVQSLAAEVARVYGAEWGSVTALSGGGYSVTMPAGALTIPAPGAALGTVAPAFDGAGKLTADPKTVN